MCNYHPIACALYSEYETAILKQQFITLRWIDDKGTHHKEVLLPYDLQTLQGEEFLLASTKNNRKHKIRLDRILVKS